MDRSLVNIGLDEIRAGAGMPTEAPLPMPVQNLRRRAATGVGERADWATRLARLLVFGGTLAATFAGATEMVRAVEIGGITPLEYAYVVLFVITFGWIAFTAVAAIVGLLFSRLRSPMPAALDTDGRKPLTALVMPVYNEDPVETAAALQAMAEALKAAEAAEVYEIVVLSDSTNADAWIRETVAFRHLRSELGGIMPVWYRRRWQNTARKAGNVADFIRRWGGRYDFFLVLDADSLLTAETIVSLTRAMSDDPRLGLLQSVPTLAGGETLFARLQQFAGAVYGPIIAQGLAVWSGNDGNYWGHNAIIRTRAFAETAGLPDLKGRKPFGGPIMSHDFVEAALMRRAGWRVRMAARLSGSYEASPPSLIDVAVRDRRWAQGNLQHVGVLRTRGLAWPSRVHLATGIMSYLSASLWLLLIMTGLALAAQAHFIRPEYFSGEFQLFPNWPRFDSERMLIVFLATMAVLLLPKLLGYARVLLSAPRRRAAGGVFLLTVSVLVETVLSALYAPIMMLIQNHHLIDILRGRDSGWATQRRGGSGDTWRSVARLHRWHTAAGIALAVGLGLTNLDLLAWMSPIILGLLLAIPLSWMSGRPGIGRTLRWLGLLLIDSETGAIPIIERRETIAAAFPRLPDDGLAFLATHADAAAAHIAFNQPKPQPVLGRPDADQLTAEAKLQDAATHEEALGWLTPAERVRVAADPRLLRRLAELRWWE
jgi:membrane glycosyltransferase